MDGPCKNIPGGFYCSCRSGYAEIGNRTCFDKNECTLKTDNMCSQECDNIDGGYECSCQSGYTLNEDGFACDGEYTFTLVILGNIQTASQKWSSYIPHSECHPICLLYLLQFTHPPSLHKDFNIPLSFCMRTSHYTYYKEYSSSYHPIINYYVIIGWIERSLLCTCLAICLPLEKHNCYLYTAQLNILPPRQAHFWNLLASWNICLLLLCFTNSMFRGSQWDMLLLDVLYQMLQVV